MALSFGVSIDIGNKKRAYIAVSPFKFGTSGRTRTDTILRSPDFESGASTNSATLAMCFVARILMIYKCLSNINLPIQRVFSGSKHRFECSV